MSKGASWMAAWRDLTRERKYSAGQRGMADVLLPRTRDPLSGTVQCCTVATPREAVLSSLSSDEPGPNEVVVEGWFACTGQSDRVLWL